jgi:hypothetical protein
VEARKLTDAIEHNLANPEHATNCGHLKGLAAQSFLLAMGSEVCCLETLAISASIARQSTLRSLASP